MVTNLSQLDRSRRYNYPDYLEWSFPDRIELLFGRIFVMAPAPSLRHQWVSMAMGSQMYGFFQGGPCTVLAAPVDVVLNSPYGIQDIVLQPDLIVVCDKKKLKNGYYSGPPNLVVEILSNGTRKKDLDLKFRIYEAQGVREYWVVDPADQSFEVYCQVNDEDIDKTGNELDFDDKRVGEIGIGFNKKDGERRYYKYVSGRPPERLTSKIFPYLEINLATVFSGAVMEPQQGYGVKERLEDQRTIANAVRI